VRPLCPPSSSPTLADKDQHQPVCVSSSGPSPEGFPATFLAVPLPLGGSALCEYHGRVVLDEGSFRMLKSARLSVFEGNTSEDLSHQLCHISPARLLYTTRLPYTDTHHPVLAGDASYPPVRPFLSIAPLGCSLRPFLSHSDKYIQ
jgi:hypothetical protein